MKKYLKKRFHRNSIYVQGINFALEKSEHATKIATFTSNQVSCPRERRFSFLLLLFVLSEKSPIETRADSRDLGDDRADLPLARAFFARSRTVQLILELLRRDTVKSCLGAGIFLQTLQVAWKTGERCWRVRGPISSRKIVRALNTGMVEKIWEIEEKLGYSSVDCFRF